MDILKSWIVVLITFVSICHEGFGYYRSGRSRDAPGGRGGAGNDCPLQCRCIALSHLGYRDMAERWMTMSQIHPSSKEVWKGTEAPVWREDPNRRQGRDVVCMGLNKVPRPLPEGTVKLTLYGDSSDMSNGNGRTSAHAQVTTIVERSFQEGEDLRQLKISGNNLHILYPFIFRNLPNLENLALQTNNITHISAAAFHGLESLKELRLSDNMIRYLSPNVFIHLISTEWLYLNGNKLSVLHDALFGRLISLEHLDLSRNNFRTFSDHVFDGMTNLKELLINENQIIHVRARWFQNLSQLKNLEIRANALTRIDPSSFKTLSNLLHLSLSANVINTISNEAFRNLSNLQSLDIGTNDINKLEPDCFAGLDSLDSLDLSVNRLYFINNKTFTATPTLRTLDLSKNSIKDIEEAALHPLAQLQELDISHNRLRKVKSKTFSGLLELKEVNLENNLISEVEEDAFIVAPLNQLSKITWLSLQYNRIKALNAYSLYGLPHMKFLNVGHNKIRTVHKKSFYTLSSLQNLILSDNRVHKLEDGTFTNLKMLYSLTLENNRLTDIHDNTFIGLKKLEDLKIVSNGIKSISPNAFRHFAKLKRLDLQNNLISTFDFNMLSLVKDLSHVDLSKNILYFIEFPKKRTHTVRNLVLSENKLETLPSTLTNVLANAGNVWLPKNPWSCDCRLDWLVRYSSEYRLRLLGSRDTVCSTPLSLQGTKITDVDAKDFKCDDVSLSRDLVCQNLQIRYGGKSIKTLKKGKGETRKWHVTMQQANSTAPDCNGVQLTENWVLTRNTCFDSTVETSVTIGRKQSRDVAVTVGYKAVENSDSNTDFRLVRLFHKKSNRKKNDFPCILTHSQYHELNTVIPVGVYTTRTYHKKTGRWNLAARRGRTVHKCGEKDQVCLRARRSTSDAAIDGSPLTVRYQGIWYLVGMGTNAGGGSNVKHARFTPLWAMADWIAATMHDIDNKCQFQKHKGGKIVTLCENLTVQGVTSGVGSEVVTA